MLYVGLTVVLTWLAQRAFVGFRANRTLSANTLFLGGLFLLAAVHSLQLVVYQRDLAPGTILFMCGSIVAFGIGSLLAGRSRAPAQQAQDRAARHLLTFALLLSIGYAFVTAMQIPRLFTSSLAELRSEHWNGLTEDRGVLGVLNAVFRAGATILILSLPTTLQARRWGYVVAGGIALIMVLIEAGSSGGRFNFIFFTLSSAIGYVALRGSRRPSALLIIVLAAIGYYALAVFPGQRNPHLLYNPLPYFLYVDALIPANWITSLPPGWLRDHLIGLAFSSTYITVTPYKLQFFIDALGVQDWFMLGSYNVRYLSFVYDLLRGNGVNFTEARETIANISAAAGYQGNPWSTGFRDLLIDFGWFGAVIVSGLLGYLLTRLSAGIYESTRLLDRCIGAMAATSGLTFAFFSPFVVTPVLNTFALLLAIKLARKIMAAGHVRISQRSHHFVPSK